MLIKITKRPGLIPSESLLGTKQVLELVPPQHPNPNFNTIVKNQMPESVVIELAADIKPGINERLNHVSNIKDYAKLVTYKMIGWLIEQYYVWFLESYLCKSNSAFLTT